MSKRSTHLKIYFMLTMGVVIYFFANLQRVAIPGSIFDELQHDLNAGAKYITALGSMFMYVYAAGQLVVGLLDDRYGGERVITFGVPSLGRLGLDFISVGALTHSAPSIDIALDM